jgi:NAD(P)-dependent dehydrogenase (short-subunit alcohol dehydrogenase family)
VRSRLSTSNVHDGGLRDLIADVLHLPSLHPYLRPYFNRLYFSLAIEDNLLTLYHFAHIEYNSRISTSPRFRNVTKQISLTATMPNKYTEAHKLANLHGPGDARPTALQIIQDEGLVGKLLDKVFIVTGASSGIGRETGRALAATGGKVFLTVRDLKKGDEECKSFLEPGRVELLEMDNNSLESVRAAAKMFMSKSKTLNVLVNNAGIMAAPEGKTKDGFESQFGVNHLAHFLFFNLLKDTMIASSTPEFHSRVVNVSSMGHLAAGVQFGNYGFEDGSYTPWGGYGQSKTANIYMANEIENRFAEKGLHGYSLHPGGIWTGLQKFVSAETMAQWKARPNVENFLKSTEQGAATTVLASLGREYEGKGRVYFEDCDLARLTENRENGFAEYAFDKEKELRLWEDSLKMVGLSEV